LKELKLAQLGKVSDTRLTAGEAVVRPMVIKNVKFFGEMKITDNCTFCEGWL